MDLWKNMDGFHSFSATRNFADRARGFSRTSASEGVIGLRVTTRTERWCPQRQTGAWGGQIQSVASTLKQEQARLSAEHDQLLAQLAGDRAANRVATAAQQLGLSHPSRWQYLHATGSPIALGPRPSDSGHPPILDGVMAVLGAITGRPLATSPH